MTARCFEQIRVDVCYHRLPVIIAGVGAGLAYASNGGTHQSCEDVALLRTLPEMTILCPGDPVEVRLALRAALQHTGPVYLRLGKKGEPVVHASAPEFVIGKALPVRAGADLCLLSTGNMLPAALQTADRLAAHQLSAQVMSFHTVKPLDTAFLAEAFARFPIVATLEEHSVIGGLGGAVAEWLADQDPQTARLCRFGSADVFLHAASDQAQARAQFGLTPEAMAARLLSLLRPA